MSRRYPIFAADVRRLGGVVTIKPGRSRTDAEQFLIVTHLSRGGDIAFQSSPIHDPDQADAAACVLAQFVGAKVDRR